MGSCFQLNGVRQRGFSSEKLARLMVRDGYEQPKLIVVLKKETTKRVIRRRADGRARPSWPLRVCAKE